MIFFPPHVGPERIVLMLKGCEAPYGDLSTKATLLLSGVFRGGPWAFLGAVTPAYEPSVPRAALLLAESKSRWKYLLYGTVVSKGSLVELNSKDWVPSSPTTGSIILTHQKSVFQRLGWIALLGGGCPGCRLQKQRLLIQTVESGEGSLESRIPEYPAGSRRVYEINSEKNVGGKAGWVVPLLGHFVDEWCQT